jgi:4-amino-4-deoxy-L-arabinose transferase-like glycosyltransferase
MTANYKKLLFFVIAIFVLKIVLLGIYPYCHPSEARYAYIAMRMELFGNYLMPYFDAATPFFAKPPLSFWASAISFKIFGFNEFAGRLPHLLALMMVCFFVHHCIAKIYDKKTAIISVLILVSCLLFGSLHSVMTEAFLLLGMTTITFSFWMQIQSEKPKNIYGYLFFVGCVISMLAKGPVGILMPCLPIFVYLVLSSRWRELFQKFPIFSGTILFIAFGLSWFVLAEIKYPGFLEYFFVGENFSRFSNAGWSGDRYGVAHKVSTGMIWVFFTIGTFPVILLLFKPKTIFKTILEIVKDKNSRQASFYFFFLSLIIPLVILTFMRNMIVTYAMYGLVPFAVIVAIIIAEKKWYNFAYFCAGFTIIIHGAAIAASLIHNPILEERLNFQEYLIKQIPEKILKADDFTLYYIGRDDGVFALKWYTKERVRFLNEDNFMQNLESDKLEKYIIARDLEYSILPKEYQVKLEKISCAKGHKTCLYKAK